MQSLFQSYGNEGVGQENSILFNNGLIFLSIMGGRFCSVYSLFTDQLSVL